MSGLLMRWLLTAGQDGFPRRELQTTLTTFLRPMGPTDCPAPRIDRSYHLLLLQLRLNRYGECRPADLSSGECRCTRHPRAIVTPPRRHQLPGDAGNLVGERHRRELCRLALQQRD